MASAIFGLAAIASILLALRKAEGNLEFYLLAQLVSIPPIWGAHYLWGDWSRWYALTYVLFTLPILWYIARICWEAVAKWRFRTRALAGPFLVAGVLGRLAFVGLNRSASYFDWINILLGVALAWGSTVLGFAAPHQKRWDLAIILAVFWMTQAVSSLGWTIHLWERLNWIIDPSLGIAAFLLLSWRLESNLSKQS